MKIEIHNLSKRYRRGRARTPTLRASLDLLLDRFQPENRTNSFPAEANAIWALKDISFAVREGETVGIVGKNGSGKSTLLKILSRITEPTEGHAILRGRVASLLEVGTGFHPELTGRENIYLNGIFIGMGRKEIDKKFDEIVFFSELESFIDMPIKRYSSGMFSRLAFSVAAHLEPDILLMDEILAVGDTHFQEKCLTKTKTFAKEGRTVLLVSHDMETLHALCHRCLILDKGRIVHLGPTKESLSVYQCDAFKSRYPLGERNAVNHKSPLPAIH